MCELGPILSRTVVRIQVSRVRTSSARAQITGAPVNFTWLERARVIPYTDECEHAELEQWPAITNDDLWATVRRECQSVRNFPDTPHKFFMALSKVLPKSCATVRKGRHKIYHKGFGTLTECRAEMNSYLGFHYFDDSECQWRR
jgi:hypothetical protein